MNTTEIITIIIAASGFILSLGTSLVVVALFLGRMQADMHNMKSDIDEIKGMFRLTLKDQDS